MTWRYEDVTNPGREFPFERRYRTRRDQLWPTVVYRYPTELGRATHLQAERIALNSPCFCRQNCCRPLLTWDEAAEVALRTGVWPEHYLRAGA